MSRLTTRILAATIAAIRPRGHGFDQPIDADVLRDVDRFFPYLPAPLRRSFPLGLLLIELGAPALGGGWRRFTRMPPADAQRYLEHLHTLGGPFAALVLGLRTLVFLAFYQHPTVLAHLEVDWAGRATALTRRRAQLLDERPA
ncbi:MAG: hypothetical protein U0807_05695 [Candidatus Binatia bacterium]